GGTKTQTAEPVNKANETGVTSARFTRRPRRCSRVSSTVSDLDIVDRLLGLLLGRRQHAHLLLHGEKLVVCLLVSHAGLQFGQAAVQVGLPHLQAGIRLSLQLLDLVARPLERLDIALDGDTGESLVELLLDLSLLPSGDQAQPL